MRIETTLFVFLLIACTFSAASQSELKIGEWKSHLPYRNGKKVTQSEEKVIYATDWSLVIVDKEELSIEFVSKVEGLSDIGIAELQWDKFNNQLYIAYNNSNIDIFSNEGVINLPNIKSNTTILGDKTIYDILVSNDNFSYFATGFGLVQFNSITKNFGFTVFTGIPVFDAISSENYLYIATEDGIYRGKSDGSVNLGDFNNWELLGESEGLPAVYSSNALAFFEGKLYASIDNALWKRSDNGVFEIIHTVDEPKFEIQYLSAEGSKLILGIKDDRSKSKALFFEANDQFIESGTFCVDRTEYAVEDQFQRVWYADEWDDIRYNLSYTDQCQRLIFNSPRSHTASDISIKDQVAYVASGGVSDNFVATSSRDGIYIYNGEWQNIHESNFSPIKENDLLNFFTILPHPSNALIYTGTYWGGLMELNMEDQSTQVFRETNSSLGVALGDVQRVRITGLAFDTEENLWISNYEASRPISVYTAGGQWHSFPSISDRKLVDVAIDFSNYKWFVVFGTAGGILVLDTGASIEDPTDDRQRFFNLSNSEITTAEIHSVAVDQDGDVWVGTSEGPVIFECGSGVFEEECRGTRRKVLQDSIAAFLLSTEVINAIAVDGANQKWFGTKNGIFVQSPDGEEQVANFNEDNSPLFDNNIIDLAYEEENGLMYIATDKGIQSLRTSSTGAKRRHSSNVYAFPNPVRPEYNGPIAIKGLARDANVKITDVNGKLVYETTALGGQAIWDGRDYNGQKANTGVYLVFSSSTDTFDDPDSFVTKILFIH